MQSSSCWPSMIFLQGYSTFNVNLCKQQTANNPFIGHVSIFYQTPPLWTFCSCRLATEFRPWPYIAIFACLSQQRDCLYTVPQTGDASNVIPSFTYSCSNVLFFFSYCQAIPNKYDHSVDEQDLTVEDWKRKKPFMNLEAIIKRSSALVRLTISLKDGAY